MNTSTINPKLERNRNPSGANGEPMMIIIYPKSFIYYVDKVIICPINKYLVMCQKVLTGKTHQIQ